jgi:hypothetical protein
MKVNDRFEKGQVFDVLDEANDIAALSASVANPPARVSVDMQVCTSTILLEEASANQCYTLRRSSMP